LSKSRDGDASSLLSRKVQFLLPEVTVEAGGESQIAVPKWRSRPDLLWRSQGNRKKQKKKTNTGPTKAWPQLWIQEKLM